MDYLFTLYSSDVTGDRTNCLYKHRHKVYAAADLASAVSHDYVCAEYKDGYRSGDNFIAADCLPVDCDNDHSEDPSEWVTPDDVAKAFPGVVFAVHYSRNHMKEKNGRAARPKFHVLFPIDPVTDPKEYSRLKKYVNLIFPYFDDNALDAARFFYGTGRQTAVNWRPGVMDLSGFLSQEEFDVDMQQGTYGTGAPITEGSRNSTMSVLGGKLVTRYGNTEEAHERFLELAERCDPPLDDGELNTIWWSAQQFFKKKVSQRDDYIPPEEYGKGLPLEPTDYSDVGQAAVLASEYRGQLRYSPSTDYIVYNGSFWEESKPKAQAIAQDLTTRQLEAAETEIGRLTEELDAAGGLELVRSMGKKASDALSGEQLQLYNKLTKAEKYRNYAIRRRDTKFITAALREARPMVEIEQRELDADVFLLNTPSLTFDLRTGEAREHRPDDFIAKQTAVDPSEEGSGIWESALDTFFCKDQELIEYVQQIAGLSAIGKVCVEGLIIAYGEGRNGKSTFWNTLARVLGSYSGNMSADTLTVGCRRNVKPELAEAKGKRLIIAAELEEGMRLNTSNVKQMCSTDDIYAEKKYKDPFAFRPSHTLVLYTNHLPKVGALDAGTWRRLIVIPFNARIEGASDIKNYADYLYERAGGAVLRWIMQGARRVIESDYKIDKPACVREAIRKYRDTNDWLTQFLEECCELDRTFTERSGELYSAYRNYCAQTGDYTRSTSDFYAALEAAGYERRKTKKGIVVSGLQLKSDFME